MRLPAAIVAAALVAGVAVRAALLWLAPAHGFFGDHVDYVCWGRQAVARGVLDLYRSAPPACPAILHMGGQAPRQVHAGAQQKLNYPPLAAYVFWSDGHLLARLDPSQTANTLTSRAVYALPTAFAELLTALGSAALVRLFAGATGAAAAFGLVLLAPPLLLDGAFWGQTEAWILAPGVWMVLAMAQGRWLVAGTLWGMALALKPSGLLFGPLWLYAFLFRVPRRRVVVLGGIAAVLTLNLAALPFWLDSGTAWLRATYLANYVYDLHWKTMMAFNLWYADLLLTDSLDSRAPLLGLSRDLWGTILLLLALLLAFVLARRWERANPRRATLGVLPAMTLVTIAAVTLPTRVHSTYGTFTAPFLICTAFLLPRTTLAAAAMVVAVSLQILSWQWGSLLAVHLLPNEDALPAARQAERRALRDHDRPREWVLTLASLGAAAAVFAGVAASGAREAGADEAT